MEISIPVGRCINKFKGEYCGYKGTKQSCNKTITECKELFNTEIIPIRIYPSNANKGEQSCQTL